MRRLFGTLASCLLLAFTAFGPAAAQSVGHVAYVSGTLLLTRLDGTSRLLAEKSEFGNGDTLSTAQDSYTRLKFNDGSEIALRPNTVLQLNNIRFEPADRTSDSFAVALLKGGVRAVTGLLANRNRPVVVYSTTVATIGIRGTHFGAMLCQNDDCRGLQTIGGQPLRNGLYSDVAAGSIEVSNQAGDVTLERGQFGYVADADTAPQLVDERDGFRVMLPLSVMFDGNGQLWADGVRGDACVLR